MRENEWTFWRTNDKDEKKTENNHIFRGICALCFSREAPRRNSISMCTPNFLTALRCIPPWKNYSHRIEVASFPLSGMAIVG